GDTATYEVVVANASGGVGDHAAVVSVEDPSVASITDASLRGEQSDEDAAVSVADDGSSVNLTAAPTEAADGEDVVVATVTVGGDEAGASDLGLRVDGLDTAAGDAYNVTGVSGAAIAVEPKPDAAEFRVSNLNASRDVTTGEPFNVTAAVTNDGDLEATQTVRYGFDRDGDGTLDDNETMAAREVTLAGHERETVTFDDVNVTDVDSGTHAHGVFTENDSVTGTVGVESGAESVSPPETAVLLRPSDDSTDGDEPIDADELDEGGELDEAGATIDAGDTATYEVVVANASGGVGAQAFRIDIDDPTHATMADVSVGGDADDATTEVTLVDDGQSANVTAALTDTDDNGSVTVATVTLRGHAVGTTDIGLRVDALGTETGTAYNVTAAGAAPISVESDYSGVSTDDGDDGDDADEFVEEVTRDEISREKYGVDFADLGSETAGAVQAIYNRQPFPDDTGPGEIRTRNELSDDRHGADFDELSRENAIEVQNDYDAQFGPLPSDPEHSRDDISQAKYDADFADLGAERAAAVQAIYNRQPFPDGTAPGEIRTTDEITEDRYGLDYSELSWQTTIEVTNDYDAQFGDGDDE
ncbi:MAG: hypothetical protein ACOC06_04700, partial [Halorubrum sp.]